jgi:hypothetical protein
MMTAAAMPMVSGFSVQVSGFWSLVTGQKQEASGQNVEARLRGRELTPETYLFLTASMIKSLIIVFDK